MIKSMMRWQAYDNLIKDILIYDGKNMDLADWLLQIENKLYWQIVKSTNQQQPNQQLPLTICWNGEWP